MELVRWTLLAGALLSAAAAAPDPGGPATAPSGESPPPGAAGRLGDPDAYGEELPDGPVFSADGRSLVAGAVREGIRAWDLAARRETLRFVDPEHALNPLAFSLDRRRLAVGSDDGTVHVLDVATGKALRRLEGLPEQPVSAAFSPDGRLLAAADDDRTAVAWDAGSGEERFRLEAADDTLETLRFSPDGSLLAASGDQGIVSLWDAATGKAVCRLGEHADGVKALAFSPDGRLLASAGLDGAVRLWDVRAGREAAALREEGRTAGFYSAAFSPDGQLLAAGTGAGWSVLWEVASGRPIRSLGGHGSEVVSLGFSAGGGALASGDADGAVLLWDLGPPAGRRIGGAGPADLEPLWARLSGGDAGQAWTAIGDLAAAGDAAAAFLGARLVPAAADPEAIRGLLSGLDDDDYGRREAATEGLGRLGSAAEPAIREALAAGPSPELKERLGRLLDLLDRRVLPLPSGEPLARLRAIRALEWNGSAPAREALARAAAGPPSAPETRAAKGALERLAAPRPGDHPVP